MNRACNDRRRPSPLIPLPMGEGKTSLLPRGEGLGGVAYEVAYEVA